MDELAESLLFLLATEFIIEADRLLAEAIRVEQRNPPWARNRRRKANRMMDKAKALCGDKGLPWGVVWSEEKQL